MANVPNEPIRIPAEAIGVFDDGHGGISFATIVAQADEFEEIANLYRGVENFEKAARYDLLSERFRVIANAFDQGTQEREDRSR